MKKEIKIVLLIVISIFLSSIINILFFSDFELKFLSNSWHKNQSINYKISDQIKIDLINSDNNDYVTKSNDSQIILNNIIGNVNDIYFNMHSKCSGKLQLFYTNHANEDFKELNSSTYDVLEGNNDYHISLYDNSVYNLRIDPIDDDNCLINVSDVNVNYSNFNIFQYMNFDKILIISVIVFFVLINIFYDRKKLYSFMFNNRIIIGIAIIVVAVIFKYNGSSMLLLNDYVQPSIKIANQNEIFGESRKIRTDEWNVSTPLSLSQLNGENKFKYFNNNFRADYTDMFVNTSAPILDIVGISKPFTWGYFILGADRGFSFWWVSRIVALYLVTIEFGMLITNKNKKLSVALAFLITFSAAVQWWYSTYLVELLVFGQLSVLLVNKLFEAKSKKTKFISATLLIISMLGFFAPLYPAWEIPLAIIFGLVGLHYCISNLKNKKISKFEIAMIIYVLLAVGLVLLRFFLLSKDTISIMTSTVYPGNRFELGGNGIKTLFNYYPAIFYPFIKIENPCEPSMLMSLFPIPIFISIFLMIKKEKKNNLVIILLFLSIIYSIYSIFGFPNWLAKITLTYFTPTIRMNVIIHLLSVYLMVISLSEINKPIINKKNIILSIFLIISYVLFTIIITKDLNTEIISTKGFIILGLMLIIYLFLYLKSDKKKNLLFLIATIIISVIGGVFVNPIIKGVNIMFDKPYAKEVKSLQEKDAGNWIVIDSTAISNYTAVQGVPVVNTVNCYPNLKRMKLLDSENKYEEVYNRYAHISIILSENDTSFKLITPDFYIIYLNINDLDKLDVKYIVSQSEINYKSLNIDKLYYEDGIYIYKLIK